MMYMTETILVTSTSGWCTYPAHDDLFFQKRRFSIKNQLGSKIKLNKSECHRIQSFLDLR